MADAAQYVRTERERVGLSTTQLADAARNVARHQGDPIQLTQQSVSAFENRGAKREPSWLRYVLAVLEGNADLARAKPGQGVPIPPLAYVPSYNVRLSAGGGSLVSGEKGETRAVAFDNAWLRDSIGRRPDQLGIFRVAGDSMEPELRDGDAAMVDLTVTRPGPHGLYALRYGDMVLVKRLAVSRDGADVEILSTNPSYPAERAPADDVQVFGRVVWIGRRVA